MYYTFLEWEYIMSLLVISGGKSLSGRIRPGGSKNAVLPIIFATLATRGISVIKNVPDITDVDDALAIISSFGARVARDGETLTVDTKELTYQEPDTALTERIRASTYLMGACLARFGHVKKPSFGGCNFEPRPIDLHLYAFGQLGALEYGDELVISSSQVKNIHFTKPSVGATANALILASSLPCRTYIHGYAKEPHIRVLAEYLAFSGAEIILEEDKITVIGGELHGATVTIPTDPIESVTYSFLSLMTDGEVSVTDAPFSELLPVLLPLKSAGINVKFTNSELLLSGALRSGVLFIAAPYPGIPTDVQPLLAPLLGKFSGGIISDSVFPRRFGYIDELRKLGLSAEYSSGKAVINPSTFHHAAVTAPDLRGGAALMLAALAADGESVIASSERIMRGYGGIIKKLRSVGAEIYEIQKKRI